MFSACQNLTFFFHRILMDALQGSVIRRENLVDKAGAMANLQASRTPQLSQTLSTRRLEDLRARMKRMEREEKALKEALQVENYDSC